MTAAKQALSGALSGLAGGMVMSMAMMMGQKTGMIKEPLPLKVERWVGEETGLVPASEKQATALSQGGHLAFSAALGSAYSLLRSTLHWPAFVLGPLYGLGLYLLNLVGVAPALGITPGPWNEQPMTAGRRVMMHGVYGLVTALTFERLRRRLR